MLSKYTSSSQQYYQKHMYIHPVYYLVSSDVQYLLLLQQHAPDGSALLLMFDIGVEFATCLVNNETKTALNSQV